jgi:dihydroorotate dehydrogenase electron transfer subunit
VAGGIGVPPIAALAARVGNPNSALRAPEVFLGGKSSDDILCVKDFEAVGARVQITTEDGSLGRRGLITDLLGPFLSSPQASPATIFTCGPPGMLSAVARLAEKHNIPCQTSVEANMACGFGACMGCAIEARSNGSGPAYKLVCKDGPVFDSRQLVWR